MLIVCDFDCLYEVEGKSRRNIETAAFLRNVGKKRSKHARRIFSEQRQKDFEGARTRCDVMFDVHLSAHGQDIDVQIEGCWYRRD